MHTVDVACHETSLASLILKLREEDESLIPFFIIPVHLFVISGIIFLLSPDIGPE